MQVERISERAGAEWAQARDRDGAAFRERRLPRLYSQTPEVAAVMPDGGRLQTRKSNSPPGVRNAQWREPKCT